MLLDRNVESSTRLGTISIHGGCYVGSCVAACSAGSARFRVIVAEFIST